MEFTLKCNNLKCRKTVNQQGYVTICSHVFCIDCGVVCEQSRKCPACETPLPRKEDVVINNVNPSESFKSTLLCGYSPETIAEICGRGLSFWYYQSIQEHKLLENSVNTLVEDKNELERELSAVIAEANDKLNLLQAKVNKMQKDRESLYEQQKNLLATINKKSKEYSQLQNMFDQLKRKNVQPEPRIELLNNDFANQENSIFIKRMAEKSERLLEVQAQNCKENQKFFIKQSF